MLIIDIYISKKLELYLKNRGLYDQFIKSGDMIKAGYGKNVDFKLRQPKAKLDYYFRINKQYRAVGKVVNNNLYIYTIDNHQN